MPHIANLTSGDAARNDQDSNNYRRQITPFFTRHRNRLVSTKMLSARSQYFLCALFALVAISAPVLGQSGADLTFLQQLHSASSVFQAKYSYASLNSFCSLPRDNEILCDPMGNKNIWAVYVQKQFGFEVFPNLPATCDHQS